MTRGRDKAEELMNILVVSRSSWSNNNNTGNTLSSIFGNLNGVTVDNIYFRSDIPNNNICRSIYQISEQKIIKSLLNRKPVGSVINADSQNTSEENKEVNLYNSAKRTKSYFPWFIREFFWFFGSWKNKALDEYLASVSPDIVFMPVYGCWYPHRVLAYIKKRTNAKIVLYHADDNYTMKQFRFSPIYWLYRLNLRKWVRRSVKNSALNFCISDLQIQEYEKALKVPCRLLTKYDDFNKIEKTERDASKPIKMVFTGNISSGRWKSLAELAKAIAAINEKEEKVVLDIYTATQVTKKMQKALCVSDSCRIRGRVDSSEIPGIQTNADILIHAESFSMKDKCTVRLSFSTKIVDYLTRARCILAIGPSDVASIAYFKNNGTAFVIDDKNDVKSRLELLISDESNIKKYAEAAWNYGKENHNIDKKDAFMDALSAL